MKATAAVPRSTLSVTTPRKLNHSASVAPVVPRRLLLSSAIKPTAARSASSANKGVGLGSRLLRASATASDTSSNDGLNRDGLTSWDPTNWVEPAAHNKNSFRFLAICAVVAIAATSSNAISPKWGAFIHMVAFATWFGSNFWTTFIGGITMYKNLPRQTFGSLQSKLFPKYFQLSAATIVTSLITLKAFSGADKSVYITLGVALLTTLVNLLWLEPASTKVMFERYSLENEKSRSEEESSRLSKLKKEFGKFHGISSMMNLIALCGSVAHAFWLSMKLI